MSRFLSNGGMIGNQLKFDTEEFYTEGDPIELVGFSYNDDNVTSALVVDYPSGVDSDDHVFLIVVYENSTSSRPSISGFDEIIGENGTWSGSTATRVGMKGKVGGDTSVTIPDIGGGNGKSISLAVVRGLDSDNAFTMTMDATAEGEAYSETYVGDLGKSLLVLGTIDGFDAQYFQSGISFGFDSDFTEDTDTGASQGRGGVGGYLGGFTTSDSVDVQTQTFTGGTAIGIQYIRVEMFSNEVKTNKRNSGVWKLNPLRGV